MLPAALRGSTRCGKIGASPRSLVHGQNWLRNAGGQQGYEGVFIEHYLLPLIYPDNLTKSIQIVLGLSVLVINTIVYCIWLSRSRQLKHKKTYKGVGV